MVSRHHKRICNALDDVISGKIRKLIINIAPRYGKTELAVKNFISYGLALNPSSKFIHLSYSDDLAHDNSEEIRDIVKSEEYQRLFPYVQIKRGTDSKKKWNTTAGGGVYAVSTGGQITGFGAGEVDDIDDKEIGAEIDSISKGTKFAGAIVIDDPIKPEDALSDVKREKINQRFETTIRNRVNSRNTPIIIIMQRLHENDLCGYLMKTEPGEWTVLSLPAIENEANGKEVPLWDFKHTLNELHHLNKINPFTFETQYMQNPTPMVGLMYGVFKTYKEIPYTNRAIRKNYTDTADTGIDKLCSIDYIDTEIGNFILNVLYTDAPMEVTEPKVATMLAKDGITVANIESNNGGRGFARNVEKQSRIIGNDETEIKWFHQSGNKEVRIFTRSAEVMNLTYMPEGWETLFPEFHAEIKSFRKFGKNAHDDGADALTGTVEKRGEFEYDSYDDGAAVLSGIPIVEIHPLLNGRFVHAKAYIVDGAVYVDDAYIGEPLPIEAVKTFVSGADVNIEVSQAMLHYVRDYRAEIGDVWARQENAGKIAYIEAFRGLVRGFKFKRDNKMSLFMRNLMDYDGKDVYEAMYVLCCIADRIKRKLKK
ncbi:phage terminase large subunit [Bacteroides sp. 44_46]|uniref:phage terminase large subunit n=1 Tax=Bacteroides sp. 44_46 TaxID=1897052 RepID=UPI0025794A23|nr:phage terminase large subunit [Bacteroides sp. 44_46]